MATRRLFSALLLLSCIVSLILCVVPTSYAIDDFTRTIEVPLSEDVKANITEPSEISYSKISAVDYAAVQKLHEIDYDNQIIAEELISPDTLNIYIFGDAEKFQRLLDIEVTDYLVATSTAIYVYQAT